MCLRAYSIVDSACVFVRLSFEKLPGVLTGEEQKTKHVRDTIIQLKSEQLKISAQVVYA